MERIKTEIRTIWNTKAEECEYCGKKTHYWAWEEDAVICEYCLNHPPQED